MGTAAVQPQGPSNLTNKEIEKNSRSWVDWRFSAHLHFGDVVVLPLPCSLLQHAAMHATCVAALNDIPAL